MKECTQCHEIKDKSDFYFANKKKGTLQSECKECNSKRHKNDYETNHSIRRQSANANRQTPAGRYGRLREDCQKRNIQLMINEIEHERLISQPCFYCKNKLGEPAKYGVGLDRLDNQIGYTLTNVVPCCNFCNIIKGFLLTSDEMKKIALLLITEREGLLPVNVTTLKNELVKSRKHPLE